VSGRAGARAVCIGIGGLGCPAALALARAGVGTIGLCDDDIIERSNLHRQILFCDSDVGKSKLVVAARALREAVPGLQVNTHEKRLSPAGAMDLVREYDIVLEGSDNFATKFLTADACALAGVPVVHASAVRWIGTVLAVGARGRPCYRCVFEDAPTDGVPNCAEAGVMGPVVGVVAAVQVDLALALLDGRGGGGTLVAFEGRTDSLRRHAVASRADCALCGAAARIRSIDAGAYASLPCET
jgi:molybdopterin/thiamine biosynthesis adenylyltransferase